jgi:hypothetical protein
VDSTTSADTLGGVKRPPTDFELLKTIWQRHKSDYAAEFPAKIAIPVDIRAVAEDLGVEQNSVFGRLYHHLDKEYGERPDEEGKRRFFFSPVVGPDMNCVNFPLLEAVLSALWQQHERDRRTYWTAIASLVISAVAVMISVLVATNVVG